MSLPDAVWAGVRDALRSAGASAEIRGTRPVGGGCISPTARLETEDGAFFLKWGSPDLPDGLLEAEARGLRQLREAGEVRVPEVIGSGGSGAVAWLLMEWLEPGTTTPSGWSDLGQSLARLHRHGAERFGAERDNFIGSLPQANGWSDSWPAFWRDHRLRPQLERALDAGLLGTSDERSFEALFERMEDLLGPAREDGPSLLHGDLWSGNVLMLEGASAAVIDPSVYHGHREVDLAMADLFGGFGSGFRAAYEEEWPLQPGYEPVRRSVYQLYYLLVHVNLFGASYVHRTRSALREAGI